MPKIRLHRVYKVKDSKTKIENGVLYINALSWYPNNTLHGIKFNQLSPYHLRTEEGYIFENYWQGSKIYPQIFDVDDGRGFTFLEGKGIDSNGPTIHHMNWRLAVYASNHPIRYPNTYEGRKTCIGAIYPNLGFISYLDSREKVYYPVYQSLIYGVIDQIKMLIEKHNITEVVIDERDVPNVEYTHALFDQYIRDPNTSFGHGWIIAKLLSL